MGVVAKMRRRRRATPVEFGKFGKLTPVARFLHLPIKKVRDLRDLGLVPLRNGFITPEALRTAWECYAGELPVSCRGRLQPPPFTLLRVTAPQVAVAGQACAPLVYRPPKLAGSEKWEVRSKE